jgi:predicted patatin/cPLA2 family phospholipase
MHKAALVLEGGSMRTLYTSGVLDVFMENNIEFELVVGVSAGALNAGNFIAKHIGRSAKINILHSNDSNYFGLRQLLFNSCIFNFNYLFYEPLKRLYPYDENALIKSKQRLLVGTTNCKTSKSEYFERNNYNDLVMVLQASSSMPLLCKPVNLDGQMHLDGSIADPIPLKKAFSEGYDKIVVVLTRDMNYKSKQPSFFTKTLYKVYSKKYPDLIKTLMNRPKNYNSQVDEINRLEKEGKIFVLRPKNEVKVRKAEKDARKLLELYFQGRDDAREKLEQMFLYIGNACD